MTLGEKLSKLRRENNYTQEQLADILGVSRQSISKWESNLAYPETEKLIRMGELFDCSMDYLLKDSVEYDNINQKVTSEEPKHFRKLLRERKSEKTVWGMPLWHVAKNARGFFAVGLNARGFIAIGLKAQGVISLGMLSIGLLSLGLLSLGLFAVGTFAIGILSAGCLSVGVLTAGAISFGIISIGAMAIGDFSVGALAIGKYFALGDSARAMIAIGDSKAVGSAFQMTGELTTQDIAAIKQQLDANVPGYLAWAKEFIKTFL